MKNLVDWATQDEIDVLDYIAKPSMQRGYYLNRDEKINRLQGWLDTSFIRKWGRNIDVEQCRNYAAKLLHELR